MSTGQSKSKCICGFCRKVCATRQDAIRCYDSHAQTDKVTWGDIGTDLMKRLVARGSRK